MRTFLTYVLAALAAAAVFQVIPPIVSLLHPDMPPMSLIGAIMTLPVTAVPILIFGAPVWALSGLVLPQSWIEWAPMVYIARGVVSFAALGGLLSALFGVIFGGQDFPGAPTVGMAAGTTALSVLTALFALLGAAWGSVFWLRAPKREEVLT